MSKKSKALPFAALIAVIVLICSSTEQVRTSAYAWISGVTADEITAIAESDGFPNETSTVGLILVTTNYRWMRYISLYDPRQYFLRIIKTDEGLIELLKRDDCAHTLMEVYRYVPLFHNKIESAEDERLYLWNYLINFYLYQPEFHEKMSSADMDKILAICTDKQNAEAEPADYGYYSHDGIYAFYSRLQADREA